MFVICFCSNVDNVIQDIIKHRFEKQIKINLAYFIPYYRDNNNIYYIQNYIDNEKIYFKITKEQLINILDENTVLINNPIKLPFFYKRKTENLEIISLVRYFFKFKVHKDFIVKKNFLKVFLRIFFNFLEKNNIYSFPENIDICINLLGLSKKYLHLRKVKGQIKILNKYSFFNNYMKIEKSTVKTISKIEKICLDDRLLHIGNFHSKQNNYDILQFEFFDNNFNFIYFKNQASFNQQNQLINQFLENNNIQMEQTFTQYINNKLNFFFKDVNLKLDQINKQLTIIRKISEQSQESVIFEDSAEDIDSPNKKINNINNSNTVKSVRDIEIQTETEIQINNQVNSDKQISNYEQVSEYEQISNDRSNVNNKANESISKNQIYVVFISLVIVVLCITGFSVFSKYSTKINTEKTETLNAKV